MLHPADSWDIHYGVFKCFQPQWCGSRAGGKRSTGTVLLGDFKEYHKDAKLRGRLRAESLSLFEVPFLSERLVPASITWSQLSFPVLGHLGDAHFPGRAFPARTRSWQLSWLYGRVQRADTRDRSRHGAMPAGVIPKWRYLQHVSVCLYSGNHFETLSVCRWSTAFPGADWPEAGRVEVATRISPTVPLRDIFIAWHTSASLVWAGSSRFLAFFEHSQNWDARWSPSGQVKLEGSLESWWRSIAGEASPSKCSSPQASLRSVSFDGKLFSVVPVFEHTEGRDESVCFPSG